MAAVSESTAHTGSGLERAIWRSWPVLVWGIPVLLAAVRFLVPNSGWDAIFLLMFFPVWYPVFALLGMTPRWVWRSRCRRAGVDIGTQPPAKLLAFMLVHWIGLLLLVVSLAGLGDSGNLASVLAEAFPLLDQRAADFTAILAALFVVAGMVGAITVASSAKVHRVHGSRGWKAIAAALLVAPVAVAAGFTVQLVVMHGEVDGLGRTELDAFRSSTSESLAAEDAMWAELQTNGAPLREAVAAEGWLVRGGSGILTDHEVPGMQRVAAVWEARSDQPVEVVLERAGKALAENGWRSDDALPGLVAVNDAGQRAVYRFSSIASTGQTAVSLRLTGPRYWPGTVGYEEAVYGGGEETPADLVQPRDGYTASDWPALGSVERSSIVLDLDASFPDEGADFSDD